jgi:hypothetical protein
VLVSPQISMYRAVSFEIFHNNVLQGSILVLKLLSALKFVLMIFGVSSILCVVALVRTQGIRFRLGGLKHPKSP